MLKKIIQIDEEKCIGCGKCASACAQGAIQMINGKAKLVAENYCDGLGVCIGHCPVDAIKIIQKEISDVQPKINLEAKMNAPACPSTKMPPRFKNLKLKNWPIQLMLIPTQAEFFEHADVMIAADCTAFTYADYFQSVIQNKVLIIACPKLDNTQIYLQKLTQIFSLNSIESVTVLHMEVPCCHGLVHLVQQALQRSSHQEIEFQSVEVRLDGCL